jgi:hypothetical protein
MAVLDKGKYGFGISLNSLYASFIKHLACILNFSTQACLTMKKHLKTYQGKDTMGTRRQEEEDMFGRERMSNFFMQ